MTAPSRICSHGRTRANCEQEDLVAVAAAQATADAAVSRKFVAHQGLRYRQADPDTTAPVLDEWLERVAP